VSQHLACGRLNQGTRNEGCGHSKNDADVQAEKRCRQLMMEIDEADGWNVVAVSSFFGGIGFTCAARFPTNPIAVK
jgi:hypothetical protein